MKYACCLLLLIGLFYLQQNTKNQINYKEGFTVPERHIDSDLQSYLKIGNSGGLTFTDDKNSGRSDNSILNRHKNTLEAKFARLNKKECKDSDYYSGCAISSPSIPKIDFRYVNLPTNKLNNSEIYNHLSICPKTYENNMKILKDKDSIGQYSGYSSSEYINNIRYIDTSKIGPIPVDPDFFTTY